MRKIEKYFNTIKYLKKSQIKYLLLNRLNGKKPAVTMAKSPDSGSLSLWMPGLDMHPEYWRRFCLEELLEGRVCLLHEDGEPGGENWANPDKSHLWNFNLHYLEFLIPLAAAYRESGEIRYYECFRDYCRRWIEDNQSGSGDGWHPYTTSLRLTNLWICMDEFGEILLEDEEFFRELNNSMYAQYLHLQKRLELHLLGNHYFENLKAVLLGTLYFQEPAVYEEYKRKFREEMAEQILPDGVHYERSPMYHKIILEDVMRAAKAVQTADGEWYGELLTSLRQMADAAYSLEEGMGHTPLFNDSGDNVARSLNSLLEALREEFHIMPEKKREFPAGGYYCLGNGRLRILFDAGEIAPGNMPGHGHCDAQSFELSLEGKPLFVNSGTGQYQGKLRAYFRSTAAHNTVTADGQEQSECWGEHRVAGRIHDISAVCGDGWVKGSLITCRGKKQSRKIELLDDENMVRIQDCVSGRAKAYFHLAPEYRCIPKRHRVLVEDEAGKILCEVQAQPMDDVTIYADGDICYYAPEFGLLLWTQTLEIAWDGDGAEHEILIRFPCKRIEENI